MRCALGLSCLALLHAPALAQQQHCLTALDGSLTACLDAASGALASLLALPSRAAPPFALTSGGTVLEQAVRSGSATVTASAAGVSVRQAWAFLPPAPPGSGAVVVDTFAPAPTSIAWDVSVTALAAGAPAWGVPVVTSLGVAQATYAASKVWAPWDRDSRSGFPRSWVDPLAPSDALPSGWWDGCYVLGSGGTAGACDLIVAPLVALLSAAPSAADAGVTLALSPADLPLDVLLTLRGEAANASLAFARAHARVGGGAPPLLLHMDLVGHAADWRASLAWATRQYGEYWEPVNAAASLSCGGLGSYSWYGDDPASEPLAPYTAALQAMSYSVNWDLSGRYFPYMGMFLPPVGEGDVWENDQEGTQPRANISYASIGTWYRTMANAGFLDLSYFNVNEYGINIQLPAGDAPAAAAARAAPAAAGSGTCADTWQNASLCMIDNFLSAVLREAWATGDRLRPSRGPIYSWQNAIVVDPGDAQYHAFLLEQLVRHVQYEDAFAGVIIDRSDWQDQFNLRADDNLTFLPELAAVNSSWGVVRSLRVTYAAMIADLRASLTAAVAGKRAAAAAAAAAGAAAPAATPLGDGIMLMNTVGNCRLDAFRHYDGQFSEGHAVNAVGLLGLLSPAILWTYNAAECCGSAAATSAYLQHHLYMGVAPMNPFPGNDHAIAWDAGVAAQYARYGALFGALRGRVWALQPHILTPNATAPGGARVNAFVVPLAGAGAGGAEGAAVGVAAPSLVLVVALAQNGTQWASVNVTAWERVWAEQSRHPLLRQGSGSAAGAAGAAGAAVQTYALETLAPGPGRAWQPLAALPTLACGAGGAPCSAVLPVPLTEGCALVRVRALA